MILPLWAWLAGGFALGAVVGSFLATIVVRWPQGRSVLTGRSMCDGCGRVLGATELIPVLSGLMQQGRCRTCRSPIARDHRVIELGAGLIGAAALSLAPGWSGLAWATFGWLLLTLAALDRHHLWLPDRLTAPLAGLGLALGGVAAGTAPLDRIIGAVVGFATLWLIRAGYHAMRGREGLGLGDAKLLGGIGAWLGWQPLPFVLLAGATAGLAAAALSGGLTRERAVPFGTALAVGALPGWLLARHLLG